MIHEKLDAARTAPAPSTLALPPWWGGYLADGPHADDYLVGAIVRSKPPGEPSKWAAAWAVRGTPDLELVAEAIEEAERMGDICAHINVKGGPARIVAPPDWVATREDWACLVAAHKFREKARHPAPPGLIALTAALSRWDGEVRRLRADGLKLGQNAPWMTARLALCAAVGAKGWWLPKLLEAK